MFAVCAGTYDAITGNFHSNNLPEQAQCCIDQCKPIGDYCKSKDKYKTACKYDEIICRDTCKLLSPEFDINNTYYKCMTKYSESDDIYNCCIQTCVPTDNMNCEQYCKFMQNNTKKIELDLENELSLRDQVGVGNNHVGLGLGLGIGLAIIICIIFVIIFMKINL